MKLRILIQIDREEWMCQEKEGLTTITKVLSRQEKGSAQCFRGGTCLNRTDTIHPVAGDWGRESTREV